MDRIMGYLGSFLGVTKQPCRLFEAGGWVQLGLGWCTGGECLVAEGLPLPLPLTPTGGLANPRSTGKQPRDVRVRDFKIYLEFEKNSASVIFRVTSCINPFLGNL